MDLALDLLSWLFLGGGVFFAFVGALGMLRLPDVYTRMHGAGMIDTLGIGLILLGLMLQAGMTLVTVKLGLIAVFVLFTSPTATHALARAALNAGVLPKLDEHPELPPPTELKQPLDDGGSSSKP